MYGFLLLSAHSRTVNFVQKSGLVLLAFTDLAALLQDKIVCGTFKKEDRSSILSSFDLAAILRRDANPFNNWCILRGRRDKLISSLYRTKMAPWDQL